MVVFHLVLIILVMYIAFCYCANKETWNKVVRLILASSLVIVNVAQLSMEVIKGESYGLTIMFLIAAVINVILTVELVRAE